MSDGSSGVVRGVLEALASVESAIRPKFAVPEGKKAEILSGNRNAASRDIPEEERALILEALAKHLHSRNVDGPDVFIQMLGRAPAGPEVERLRSQSPLDVALGVLRSSEWGHNFARVVKEQTDVGSWRYLIHIPKTAGSKMQRLIVDGDWGPSPTSYVRIPADRNEGSLGLWTQAQFVADLFGSDNPNPFVAGHVPIGEVNPFHTRRSSDVTIAAVRDPLDQALSWVGYLYKLQEAGEQNVFHGETGGRFTGAVDQSLWKEVLLAVVERSGSNRLAPAFYFGESIETMALELQLARVTVVDHSNWTTEMTLLGANPVALERPVNAGTKRLSRDQLTLPEFASLAAKLAESFSQHRVCLEHASRILGER